jgi:LCP family protein required for cell wall assembly
MSDSKVTNILVIGSDTRDADSNGRTDSMILLSINRNTKKITMTSFMRDMYVEIKGKTTDGQDIDTWDKMNAAYVYGGAELLMDTIEYNFDIAVDDYVYFDFYSFVDIVDALGGIEIEITDEEAEGMKAPMSEQNKILGNEQGTDYLSEGGKILMNGNQALAYSRLRYVGNADFERTERQRTVMTKIIEKAKSSGLGTINDFMEATLSNLTTNMSKPQMMLTAYKALFSMSYEMVSLRIPADDAYSYGTTDSGQSILNVDFDKCKELLREEIYS